MMLARRPLRTMQLAERIQGTSARSVYRCISKLETFGLVERHEQQGVPSTVLLKLSNPAGRSLCRLLMRLELNSRAISLAEPRREDAWETFSVLGDLWEAGVIESLAHGPRSLTELGELPHSLTYHQVRRRVHQLTSGGLLAAHPFGGNGRRFDFTDRGRRSLAIIAALARWRKRHNNEAVCFQLDEMATMLHAVIPLIHVPDRVGQRLDISVAGPEDRQGRRKTRTLQAVVARDDSMRTTTEDSPAAGSASATVNTWLGTVLDNNRGRIRVRGDYTLVDDCLTQLHKQLWAPKPN